MLRETVVVACRRSALVCGALELGTDWGSLVLVFCVTLGLPFSVGGAFVLEFISLVLVVLVWFVLFCVV